MGRAERPEVAGRSRAGGKPGDLGVNGVAWWIRETWFQSSFGPGDPGAIDLSPYMRMDGYSIWLSACARFKPALVNGGSNQF